MRYATLASKLLRFALTGCQFGWDTHTRLEKSTKLKFLLVILRESKNLVETALYIRHLTSFRYREIATPNKSARNDKYGEFDTARNHVSASKRMNNAKAPRE